MPKIEEKKVYRCSCPDCARMSGRCDKLYLSYSGAYAKERKCPMNYSNRSCATCKHFDRHHQVALSWAELDKIKEKVGIDVLHATIDSGMYCNKKQEELRFTEKHCEHWERGKNPWEPSDEQVKRERLMAEEQMKNRDLWGEE